MSTDSQPTSMPLAEAILHWSDPALLDAIRTAEAGFKPGELDAAGETTLANVVERRMRHQRGAVIHITDTR